MSTSRRIRARSSTWLTRLLSRGGRSTLRVRIAFFSAILVMVVSTGLVLFIDLIATVSTPSSETMPLDIPRPTPPLGGLQPGEPTPVPAIPTGGARSQFSAPSENAIRQTLLGRVELSSIIGLAGVAVLAGAGGYWIAGLALRPLGRMTHTVRGIRSDKLDQRLELESADQEIKALAEAFDSMLDNLQNSFAQQGNMASMAAHELRTPMATLRTSLEIVNADPNARVEDYRQLVPVVSRTLARMDRLIADLLVMAKEESSLIHEEIALRALVSEVLDDLTPLASEHDVQLHLTPGEDVAVYGDPVLLARVFSNLLENGIRYNHKDGMVTVDIEKHGSQARVTISDTGVGISLIEQARVFQQFYRVPGSRHLHKGGAGLGLSIVSHILRLHKGQIQVENESPQGTRFVMEIPVLS